LTGIRQLEIREVPEPEMGGPRDVRLRIDAVGVCGSDLHYYTRGSIGPQVVSYPWIVGHECAGVIVETGPEVRNLKAGQRVAVDPLVTCGECDQCRVGRVNTCRHQQFLACPGQLPGALVEHLVLPEDCCFPIPDSMTMPQAVATEPLAIGVHAHRLARPEPGAKIGILGSGPIGLSVLLACRAAGKFSFYATDLLEERLAVARQCGADWTGNPRREDVVASISRQEPLGLDFAFECAGQQETLDQAVELLKPGGTLLMIGIPEEVRVSFKPDAMRRKELRLQNVRRQNGCVPTTIELVASGKINLDPLLTHNFPFAETKGAFDLVAAYRDGVVKATIHIPDLP
jgi:L-iditol 2-dehydrogenase